MSNRVEHIVLFTFWVSLLNCLFEKFAHFVFLLLYFKNFFSIPGHKSSIRYFGCKYFLPVNYLLIL